MRRYTVTVNDRPHVIDVEEVTASSFRVFLDGRTVDVRLDDHQDLAQAVIAPTLEVRDTPPALQPHVSAPIPVPIPAPLPSTAASAPRPGAGPVDALTAPMPGVVLSVEVSTGATVKRGDALLMLEAMKMKNSLHAPRDGVISEVLVRAGQQVMYGEVLVKFRAA